MIRRFATQSYPSSAARAVRRVALGAILLLAGGLAAQAQVVEGEHVDAELVAQDAAAVPGEDLWVALRLDHADNWHTYWKNPGDAGKPTEIRWNLPQGVSAGAIVWPVPERLELPADLVDFGYEGEIFLLTRLSVPADFSGATLSLSADANWLECEDICIPGNATLQLELPVARQGPADPHPRWAEDFQRSLAALPREIPMDAMFNIQDGKINLLVQVTDPIFDGAEAVRFLPGQHRVFDYTAPQEVSWQLSSLQISQAHHARLSEPPQSLEGLLVVEEEAGGEVAYQVMAAAEQVDMSALGAAPAASGGEGGGDMSLWLVFSFALLGGMILNLMPCVFPILSLKALSLASSSASHHRVQRLHGLAYTAGVVAAFLALASVLLSLQAGGAVIGWGFHLQSPWFVGALIYLFFLMGLTMSGVVEFGTSIMGMGSDLTEQEGYKGSFFTGVLASVVASPCTAPFMGTALGFAFTQSMPVALTVFVALGLGMALPFLLFSFVPALARLLPRPGQWMVTFKQLLAFPLYATVVWLLWVLGRQAGSDGMALVTGSCVLLAFAAWLWQRRHQAGGFFWRYGSVALILLCVAAAFGVLRSPLLETAAPGAAVAEAGDGVTEPFSAARLDELRAGGEPVFVNMTASWCITCLVNERVALSSRAVMDKMVEKNVTYLKGDWTNNDPEITAVLKRYKTSGVPLYLLFPAGGEGEARVMPQILTESLLLEALDSV